MSRGVAVVGAASMGALRAAELYPDMIGVGFIYRWYRRFALAADDVVAVQHGPEELNFVSLNDALIDLRLTFRLAQRQNRIPRELAQKLEISAKALNFRERALSRVISDALPNATNSELNDTNAILAASFVRQKHVDALKALDLVRTGSFKTPKIPGEFVMTRAFANDLLDSGIDIEHLHKVPTGQAFT
jgi:hypothetical protein